MRRNALKLGLWLALAVVGLFAVGAAVVGLGQLLAYFQAGADPASALNLGPDAVGRTEVALRWLPEEGAEGRRLDDFTRRQIERGYLNAWLLWNTALAGGGSDDLSYAFGGPMLDALEAADRSEPDGHRVRQADRSHVLALRFFSDDGQIVAFEDREALLAHRVEDGAGEVVEAGESQARFEVLMLLEDGRWRVRQMTRTQGALVEAGAQVPLDATGADLSPAVAPLARIPAEGLAGVNYYPQADPWDRFWPSYAPAVIDADFARIRALGLNAVRVFVPYEGFGAADPSPEMMDRLADLLERAAAHELKVIVTVMDFWTGYAPEGWAAADRHLEGLVPRFADASALLAWDLKNQADLDDVSFGRRQVDAWLSHAARTIHRLAPGQAVTVGWSNPGDATRLIDELDILSFHFYAPAKQLDGALRDLRAAAGEKPILLTEFGLPTWNPVWFPGGHGEAEQAAHIADLLEGLRATHIDGHFVWTLYDLDHIPPEVGRRPWQAGPERHLGVLRRDGSAKPAAALVGLQADLAGVQRPAAWHRFLKPFWLALAGLLALLALGVVVAMRRRSARAVAG